ncbi:hypothetical protein MAP00_005207 [Monascus purpureus]|nr:hypothetical protein MAP00_005207 [Monascus purpureus]
MRPDTHTNSSPSPDTGHACKSNPHEIYGKDIDPEQLESILEDEPWVYLAHPDTNPCWNGGKHAGLKDTLVITVIDTCCEEGTPPLVGNIIPTAHVAELSAGIVAPAIVAQKREFVAESMTEDVFKWKQNGYIDADGAPVACGMLFESIDKGVVQ